MEEKRQFSLVFPDGVRIPCETEQAAIDWAFSPAAKESGVKIESRVVRYGEWEEW